MRKLRIRDKYHCALCGRQLPSGTTKLYWPAFQIREVRPDFKGEVFQDFNHGIPKEHGGFVCRVRVRCEERIQQL